MLKKNHTQTAAWRSSLLNPSPLHTMGSLWAPTWTSVKSLKKKLVHMCMCACVHTHVRGCARVAVWPTHPRSIHILKISHPFDAHRPGFISSSIVHPCEVKPRDDASRSWKQVWVPLDRESQVPGQLLCGRQAVKAAVLLPLQILGPRKETWLGPLKHGAWFKVPLARI